MKHVIIQRKGNYYLKKRRYGDAIIAQLAFVKSSLELSSLRRENQIFHYTHCNTPKRVTSLRGPSPRHYAWAAQLLLKKCRSGGEPLATVSDMTGSIFEP